MKKSRNVSWILFYRSCPDTIFCNGFNQEGFVFSLIDPTKPVRDDNISDLEKHILARGIDEPVVRGLMEAVGVRM